MLRYINMHIDNFFLKILVFKFEIKNGQVCAIGSDLENLDKS